MNEQPAFEVGETVIVRPKGGALAKVNLVVWQEASKRYVYFVGPFQSYPAELLAKVPQKKNLPPQLVEELDMNAEREEAAIKAYPAGEFAMPGVLAAIREAFVVGATWEHDQAKQDTEVPTTPRGFGMYADFEYRDYRSTELRRFTVQESSLATERKVWVGVDDRSHLNEAEARTVRDALTRFLNGD